MQRHQQNSNVLQRPCAYQIFLWLHPSGYHCRPGRYLHHVLHLNKPGSASVGNVNVIAMLSTKLFLGPKYKAGQNCELMTREPLLGPPLPSQMCWHSLDARNINNHTQRQAPSMMLYNNTATPELCLLEHLGHATHNQHVSLEREGNVRGRNCCF